MNYLKIAIVALFVVLCAEVKSQCVSETSLEVDTVWIGTELVDTISIAVKKDTNINLGGFSIGGQIDSMIIDSMHLSFISEVRSFPGYWKVYGGASVCIFLKGEPNQIGRDTIRLWGTVYMTTSFGTKIVAVQEYEIPVFVANKVSTNDLEFIDCKIYPNPTTNEVKLSLQTKSVQIWDFTIYSSRGLIVQRSRHKIESGQQSVPFDFGAIPPGIYFIRGESSERNVLTTRVIKI